MLRIQQVIDGHSLRDVRNLLKAYGDWRGHDQALGKFEQELLDLPGPYQPPSGCLLIAYWKGEAAGCVAFRPESPGICELKRMFVQSEFRGHQIGRKLLYSAIEKALQQGYSRMRLDTHPHMEPAIALYLASGFEEVERYNANPTPGIRFFERVLP